MPSIVISPDNASPCRLLATGNAFRKFGGLIADGLLKRLCGTRQEYQTGYRNSRNKIFDSVMEPESDTSRCPESEQLKKLALLVRQGRFFQVQEWLWVGKP